MSSVKFINIQDFVVDLERQCKITIEYITDENVQVSHRDWIAIYPHGSDVWSSFNLDLMVTYEFVSGPRKGEKRYKMQFNLKGAKKVKYDQQYQFVYVSRYSGILGVSAAFEFCKPVSKENIPTSQVGQNNDNKENVDEKLLSDNRKKRNRRSRQPLVKVESEKSESEDKGGSGDNGKSKAKNFINKFQKNKQVFVNKQMGAYSNSESCLPPRLSPPVSCSNCHRVGSLLRLQEELYTNIKSLAEFNNELRNQVAHLQRQIELGQAAYQKLSVILMRERQAKMFYQAAAYERAECEYKIMVLEPFVPGIFTPRDLPGRNSHRADEKARSDCSVLKLKAIIGNQEEKIRCMAEKISELQMGNVQKVRAIVRDIEESGVLNSTKEEFDTSEEEEVVD